MQKAYLIKMAGIGVMVAKHPFDCCPAALFPSHGIS